MNIPGFIEVILSTHALLAFFIFTLVYSFTLPICEEIALILVGILVHTTGVPLWLTFLAVYPGIYISDFVYYWLARFFGGRLLRSRFFSKFINPKKLQASEIYFKRFGPRITFFCRFIVGIRAPAMVTAGMMRMKFRLFAFYDGLAAIVSTVFWVLVGFLWGDMLGSSLSNFGKIASIVSPIAVVVMIALMYLHIKKNIEADELESKLSTDTEADETVNEMYSQQN